MLILEVKSLAHAAGAFFFLVLHCPSLALSTVWKTVASPMGCDMTTASVEYDMAFAKHGFIILFEAVCIFMFHRNIRTGVCSRLNQLISICISFLENLLLCSQGTWLLCSIQRRSFNEQGHLISIFPGCLDPLGP